MQRYAWALAAILSGCAYDEYGNPPPIHHGCGSFIPCHDGGDGTGGGMDMDTETFGDTTLSEPGEGGIGGGAEEGADESGGEVCDDDLVAYNCLGWAAGVHRPSGLDTGQRKIKGSNIGGLDRVYYHCYEPGSEFEANLWIIAPWNPDPDAQELQELIDMCVEECEEQLVGNVWLPDPNWTWDRNVCLFAVGGYDTNGMSPGGGEVPAGMTPPDANGTVGDNSGVVCPAIYPGASPVVYNAGLTEVLQDENGELCTNVSCSTSEWDPAATIAYTTNSTTKTVTTSMPRSFVDDIVEEGLWHNIYQCDTGRYFMSDDGPPEAWSMEWLSSTENGLLYEMGFRTDDYDLTIRRNAHGSTVYVLDSDGMVDAWNALKAYNSFVITFKRPVAPTGYHTYTMTLTLT